MCRRRPERNSSKNVTAWQFVGADCREAALVGAIRPSSPAITPLKGIMNSTDFMLWGEAETSDTGGISQCQLRNALLPHNPRRCLVQPVLLTSNNRKESRFVTPSDLTSSASKLVEDATAPSALGAKTHGCTDFITIGYVEGPAGRGEPVEGVAQLPIAAASSALLHRPHKTRPVTLTSNNAKCEHFVVDGYCSAPLTSQDVLWMETVAQVKPGV